MAQCPQWLSWFCEQTAYLPDLRKEEWLSFILGTMVVTFFAIDHYKLPTYAKTTIGEFIELAPESLTSERRYRKGLYIYILLMFGLYLAFCFFWSQGLSTILASFGTKIDNTQLWPLAAATAVTLLGTATDKNPFGRIETALRSIAHESAYIPEAVLTLSTALNGTFAITEQMMKQLGEENADLLAKIRESQDGSLQTWIRARYLFARFDLLRNEPEFQQLFNRLENVRAFNFLNEERQTLTDRVAQRLSAKHTDLDDILKKRVENFRNAISVFLASLLWQGYGSEADVHRGVVKLKLSIDSGDELFSWNFMARVLGSLCAAAVVAYIGLHLFDWHLHAYFKNDFWHLTVALLIFLMTALFVTKRRESRLLAGINDHPFDASLGSAFWCGVPIGFAATVAAFAFHQGGPARFWAMLCTGLSLAILAAFLFETVMRWAAQSPPVPGSLRQLAGSARSESPGLRGLVARSVLLYMAVAFAAVFMSFWIGQQIIVNVAPAEKGAAAEALLTKVIKGYSSNPSDEANQVDGRFREVRNEFSALQSAVKDAQDKVTMNAVDDATIGGIVKGCEKINISMNEKVLLPSCRLNGEVTRTFGESEWLEHFRNAMIQVGELVAHLEQLRRYGTPLGALRSDWPRALVVSGLWAWLAAVFAGSIFLYRRNVLWDTINRKVLSEYTADLETDRERWLRTPIGELRNMTPLEAIRYHDLRSTLSDYLNTNKPQHIAILRAAA